MTEKEFDRRVIEYKRIGDEMKLLKLRIKATPWYKRAEKRRLQNEWNTLEAIWLPLIFSVAFVKFPLEKD